MLLISCIQFQMHVNCVTIPIPHIIPVLAFAVFLDKGKL